MDFVICQLKTFPRHQSFTSPVSLSPFAFPFRFPFPSPLRLRKLPCVFLDVRHVLLWPVHHSSNGCFLHVYRPAVQRLLLEVIQNTGNRLILACHWVGNAGPPVSIIFVIILDSDACLDT